MMNVLIIPSWYPNTKDDTSGIFLKEQSEALNKNGCNVIVSAVIPHRITKIFDKNIKTGIEKEVENGITVYRYHTYNIFPKMPVMLNIIYYYCIKKIMKNIYKDEIFPDIIHLHSFCFAGYAAKKIAGRYKIPYIYTEHSSGFGLKSFNKMQIILFKKVIKGSSYNIAVSDSLKQDMMYYLDECKINIIPNMVNDDFFKVNKEHSKNRKFTFFSLGLLNKEKKFDIVIKAFSKIKNLAVRLLIGGEGPEKENLIRLAEDLGVISKIDFLGKLDREEVQKYMELCDVFVLASKKETFGVVLIEALAKGKPVLSTKSGGPQSIVDKNNGKLVEINDVDGLSKEMKYFIENISKYNSDMIRKKCYERYSESSIVSKIIKIYYDVTGKKN